MSDHHHRWPGRYVLDWKAGLWHRRMMVERPTGKPLVIAVAQPLSIPNDVSANASKHAELIRSTDARVVVFPELSLTGYELDSRPVDPSDSRLSPIVAACRTGRSVALVGAPIAGRAGRSHIAMLAVDGRGVSVAYRKMWLGLAERARFSPGHRPAVAEIDGRRLGLAICRDTGIPKHAADTAALGIDVYVAGALEQRSDADVQPARARPVAADHGVWVAVACYAGATGGGFEDPSGGSGIWRPDGSVAALAGSAVDEMAVAEIPSRRAAGPRRSGGA